MAETTTLRPTLQRALKDLEPLAAELNRQRDALRDLARRWANEATIDEIVLWLEWRAKVVQV